MSRLRALRAAARVEWRQVRRHPGRSLLVMLLVTVPVAAITSASILGEIIERTPEERRAAVMGRAALRVEVAGEYDALERARVLLPERSRVERVYFGQEDVRAPGRRLRAGLLAAAPASFDSAGLATGLLRVTRGRAPANSGEVALSPTLLEGLGRDVGGTVALAYGPLRTITGVVVNPEALDEAVVLRTPAVVEGRGVQHLLVDPPAASAEGLATRLRAAGFAATTRREAGRGDGAVTAMVVMLGSLGFLEAGLVIAAAFAVSLRRRQREIGLLGSVGATSGGIVGALLIATALLAGIGAVLGAIAGTGIAAVLYPFLDGWNRRMNGAFEIPAALVAGAAISGVLAAVLAATLPARSAARLPIRVALGGRRPVATHSRTWAYAGLAMVAVALALLKFHPRNDAVFAAIAIVGGSILGVLGFGAMSPWVLDRLARWAAPLPLAWRLAVRDAGRFRSRNGPVVTAVLAAMSMAVTVAAIVASVESALDAFPATLRDDQLLIEGPAAEDVARRLAREFRCVADAPLTAVYSNGMPLIARRGEGTSRERRPAWVACGDAELLRALDAEAGAEALRAGSLLDLHTSASTKGARLTVGMDGPALDWPETRRIVVKQSIEAPTFVLSAERLESHGLGPGPPPRKGIVPRLLRLEAPVTARVLERAHAIAAEFPGTSVDAERLHRAPGRTVFRVLLLICLVTGLIVVLVATALSAAESAGDERVLHTVGASPALMRGHGASRAAYLAFLGCALAVPAGLVPAAGMLASANISLDFVLPLRDVLLTMFALPLVAYVLTWLSTRPGRAARGAGEVTRWWIVILIPLLPGVLHSAPAPEFPIRWEPYAGRAVDGSPLAGELGRITVPERRSAKNGRTIEIAFVRYRTTNPNPGPPILYLEGGPGAPGVTGCAFPATHPRMRLLEQADIIGVDQRGTGLSRPSLDTPEFGYALPLDRAITREDEAAAFAGAAARATAYWRARGIDGSAYNSVESADDVDDVRRALGLPRIVTYGSSYGSHLSLAYLRRHAEHVERAVLVKVEGPDHTWKLPSTVQGRLEHVHALAARDPEVRKHVPDLLGTVRALLRQLERKPVTVALAGAGAESVRVTLGPYDLRRALTGALASTRTVAAAPDFVYQMSRGDWTALAGAALDARRDSLGSAMAIFMDCASGASAARRERIRREAADPANLLGDALHAPFYPEACAACGDVDLGDAFRGPLECGVPVLFVSGELDARTPPRNVEEILAGFTNAAHVVVRNAGHDSRELISEEYRDLLQAFLRGEKVESCTIALPLRFDPIRVK